VNSLFRISFFCLAFAGASAQAQAQAPAKPTNPAPANAKPAPAEAPVPQSVFIIPRNPQEGRDPFFPLSTSVYTRYGAVAAQTNRVAVVADLKLQGFSGPNEHRLAIINNRTFEVSEEADVSTSSGRVRIRCLEIKNESVVVQFVVGGERRELRLRQGV